MKTIRIIFALAAAWGFLALIPGLFGESTFNAAMPPAITHPEFYYGFHGLALVFQFIFIMIALDPVRYQPLIGIAILEKLAFFLPSLWLYFEGRLSLGAPFYGAIIDAIWAVLFLWAWWIGRNDSVPDWSAQAIEGSEP